MRMIFEVAATGNVLTSAPSQKKCPFFSNRCFPQSSQTVLTPNLTKAVKRREEVIYEKVRGIKRESGRTGKKKVRISCTDTLSE